LSADPTRLVLLGSKGGPALRPGGPWPSSSLLEIGGRNIVVDCGLGVTRALADAGISLKALDLVFITHLHSDHVLELGPLIHTAWTAGLATPLTVFGPPGTGHYWQRFCQVMEFDIEIRIADEGRPDIKDMVSIIEFGQGRVMEERGLRVSALRVDHPPVTDCFALRFEHAGQSVVFSADMKPCWKKASSGSLRKPATARGSENICSPATVLPGRRVASRPTPGSGDWCSTTSFRPTIPRSARPTGLPPSGKHGRVT
jgi:ribonuclease BN (tRNA processing enzyme)